MSELVRDHGGELVGRRVERALGDEEAEVQTRRRRGRRAPHVHLVGAHDGEANLAARRADGPQRGQLERGQQRIQDLAYLTRLDAARLPDGISMDGGAATGKQGDGGEKWQERAHDAPEECKPGSTRNAAISMAMLRGRPARTAPARDAVSPCPARRREIKTGAEVVLSAR